MRSIYLLLIMLCFVFASAQKTKILSKNGSLPELNIQEFHIRGGLVNLFQKIATQRQVRIGYFGGSITEAEDGWRNLTFSWFRLAFPRTAFYQIAAAVGGTGSDLGVFRISQELLTEKPDLIFIEFAVNDASRSRESIIRSMEGIIRKIWTAVPTTDICFIYTMSESTYKSMITSGKSQSAVLAMEELAEYYKIPSIHVGMEVARLRKAGKLILSGNPDDNANTIVFTQDHTHPLPESGHPLYASVVVKYLKKMSKPESNKGVHKLLRPYNAFNFQNAAMVDVSETHFEGHWVKIPKDNLLTKLFKENVPIIYKGSPGSFLQFEFKGTAFGVYDCIGPGTGIVEISIDGIKQNIYRFDKYCHYYRKSYFIIDSLQSGIHNVQIRVLDHTLNKTALITNDNDDRSIYKETDWYPVKVMILGEMVNSETRKLK